jgi:hypothetical protein
MLRGRPMVVAINRGAQAELIACAYLLAEGYDVFRNVPRGSADIIACKGEEILRIDVKSSQTGGLTSKQLDEGVVLLFVDANGRSGFESSAPASGRNGVEPSPQTPSQQMETSP